MRYILLVLLAFVTTFASAQVQYLGSPTTTVRNRGNFVSDSLFYLPKRQKLPSDTGALRYQISDSALYVWTGSAWRTAGTAGSAITGSGVAGYMPEFTTSTNLDTTRLYHSAGRFAIGSTTTTNGVFNVYGGQAYFDTSLKVGTQTLLADEGKNEVYVNTTADSGDYSLQVGGNLYADGDINLKTNSMIRNAGRDWLHMGTSGITRIYDGTPTGGIQFYNGAVNTALLSSSGEFLLGAPNTDAGAYRLQVSGDIYNTGGAVLAATSGNVGIKIANPSVSLDVLANSASNNTVAARFRGNVSTNNNTQIRFYGANAAADQWAIGNAVATGDATRNFDIFDLVASNNRLRIKDDGEVLIGTTTDAGAYALQVAGSIYNTTGGQLAASSGNVQFGVDQSYIYNSYDDIAALFQRVGTFGPVIRLGRQGVANQASLDVPVDGFFAITTAGSERLRIQNNGEVLIGTTTDAGVYALQVTGAIYNTTTITTGAPTGGSIKPWRLGEAATVSPTSPNRTIRVEIDGTVYYIHAKTTND